jgi:hypothetical protein
MSHSSRNDAPLQKRRPLLVSLGVAALAIAGLAAGASAAGEIGTGGGGGGGGGVVATCNPVTSLTAKGDPKVGELGFASIAVSYSVKPCTNGQSVTVANTVSEYLDPSVVIYSNPDAPLSGKFVANGVRLRVTYRVTIDVYDSSTGALVGTLSTFAAAVPKGV